MIPRRGTCEHQSRYLSNMVFWTERVTCNPDTWTSGSKRPCPRPPCRFRSPGQTLRFSAEISGYSTSSGSRRKGLVPGTSLHVKILGLGNVQFFFVSTVDGLADTIICPAFLATSRRVAWISFRFGSPILRYPATEGGLKAEKGIVDCSRTMRLLLVLLEIK